MWGLVSKLFSRAFSWQPPISSAFFLILTSGLEQCVGTLRKKQQAKCKTKITNTQPLQKAAIFKSDPLCDCSIRFIKHDYVLYSSCRLRALTFSTKKSTTDYSASSIRHQFIDKKASTLRNLIANLTSVLRFCHPWDSSILWDPITTWRRTLGPSI